MSSSSDRIRTSRRALTHRGWWYASDMMKRGRTVVSASTALLVWLGGALIHGTSAWAVNQADRKAATISVMLRAKETTVKTGDALVIEQTMTNRSDHEVTIG